MKIFTYSFWTFSGGNQPRRIGPCEWAWRMHVTSRKSDTTYVGLTQGLNLDIFFYPRWWACAIAQLYAHVVGALVESISSRCGWARSPFLPPFLCSVCSRPFYIFFTTPYVESESLHQHLGKLPLCCSWNNPLASRHILYCTSRTLLWT